jgi:hypothetical protein
MRYTAKDSQTKAMTMKLDQMSEIMIADEPHK